jgi:hypothetical protein
LRKPFDVIAKIRRDDAVKRGLRLLVMRVSKRPLVFGGAVVLAACAEPAPRPLLPPPPMTHIETPSPRSEVPVPSAVPPSDRAGASPCGVDQFRQFECERATGLSFEERTAGAVRRVPIDACPMVPQRGGLGTGLPYPITMWRPATELRLDPELTETYRRQATTREHRRRLTTWSSQGCCYSTCVDVPVRPAARSTHNYRSIVCIPELTTSQPADTRPGCPIAIAFPQDIQDHIAAFDPAATQTQINRLQGEPIAADLAWCCYGAAPLAAIGPE